LKYKHYPSCTDTGIHWLGKIPTHWNISRVSELAQLINGFPFDSQYFVRGAGTPLIRIRDLASSETEVNYAGPAAEDAWVYPGDLIIGMDGEFNLDRWRGSKALLNQRLCCLRQINRTDMDFISYALPLPLKVINDLTYSTTVKHLSSDDVRKARLPMPPAQEQRAIVSFLNHETAKIDALIEKKERLIELLQEKRMALITQAVTKGLDPNVPMKDSGVEWLDEIPEHWIMMALKYLVPEITVGIVVTPAKYYVDDGITCLRSLNISRGDINLDELVFISKEANELHRKSKIFKNDIVVVRTGQTGTAAIIPAQLDGTNCIDLLIIRRSDRLLPKFVYYYLNSWAAISQAEILSVGAIQAHYNTATLAELVFPAAPLAEQAQIVDYLDEKTVSLNALIEKIAVAVNQLKEYRAVLISSAVTGKIDIRGI
jgi:type I restriction enzyme S subunit